MKTNRPLRRILVVDTNFLCFRAFHTTGGLTHKEIQTGVVFGVLREFAFLQSWYKPDLTVWAFDSRHSKRKDIYSDYKCKRNSFKTKEEEKARSRLHKEIITLRREYLPELGFKNIFQKRGYEADDIIASICENKHFSDEVVIVAADKDLYQLLAESVLIYNPIKKKEYTKSDFVNEWKIPPASWAAAKAIAGCTSDNIPGVEGVGEKTAAKWLRGEAKHEHKKTIAIANASAIVSRNSRLTTLPLPGVGRFEVNPDKVSSKRWKRLAQRLGMRSLIEEMPEFKKRKKRK